MTTDLVLEKPAGGCLSDYSSVSRDSLLPNCRITASSENSNLTVDYRKCVSVIYCYTEQHIVIISRHILKYVEIHVV